MRFRVYRGGDAIPELKIGAWPDLCPPARLQNPNFYIEVESSATFCHPRPENPIAAKDSGSSPLLKIFTRIRQPICGAWGSQSIFLIGTCEGQCSFYGRIIFDMVYVYIFHMYVQISYRCHLYYYIRIRILKFGYSCLLPAPHT